MGLSQQFHQYDDQEEKDLTFKRDLEAELESNYLTFYEMLSHKLKIDPLTFSLIFAGLLFLLHLMAAIVQEHSHTIIEDFSYFLSLLNGVGLYLLFSATEKFREFMVNLIMLKKNESTNATDIFLKEYRRNFLGKRTIIFGVFFGFFNCTLSIIFGVNYLGLNQHLLLGTFLLQIFTIGFIGGITVNATIVVVRLIQKISLKDEINLRYFYPDKCAGTLVIGNILFLFSVHFMIIGILIFLFIHNFNWTNQISGNYYVNALIIFWKIFPFLLSGIVFFLPVKKINSILREYKLFEQLRIRKQMNHVTDEILSLEPNKKDSKEKMEILDNHLQKLVQIDQQIEGINTWPYNLGYRATFLSIFLPILIGIILELSKKIISNLF